MVTMVRTVSGLLYQSDGSLAGWTSDGTWASVADTAFVPFDPSPIAFLGPVNNGKGSNYYGTREILMFQETASGPWWLQYDSWTPYQASDTGIYLARSDDRGLTWTKLGPDAANTVKASGGNYPSGTWNGHLHKFGSTYYRTRVCTPQLLSDGEEVWYSAYLGQGPYLMDLWSCSTVNGSWSAVRDIPVAGVGTWCYSNPVPGNIVYDGTTYHLFVTASDSAPGTYTPTVGRFTSSTVSGAYTIANPVIYDHNSTSHYFENAKCFKSTTLSTYVLTMNAVGTTNPSGSFIAISTNVADWSSAKWRRIQQPSPMDGTRVIGVMTLASKPEGAAVEGPDGEILATYDTDPSYASMFGSWHGGRRGKAVVLEPAANSLSYAGSGDTTSRALRRSVSHTDCVIECAAVLNTINGGGGSLTFEYRSDGGSNCYRARLTASGSFALYKVVSGTESSLASTIGTLTWTTTESLIGRLKVKVTGNVHTAYLDGELQYTYTDSSSPITSGTQLGMIGKGVAAQVWLFSVRTSDTITLVGMAPETSAWLRTFGAYPIGAFTSDSTGTANFTHPHSPLWGVELGGTDYIPTGGIWGGDTLTFSGVPAVPQGSLTRFALGGF